VLSEGIQTKTTNPVRDPEQVMQRQQAEQRLWGPRRQGVQQDSLSLGIRKLWTWMMDDGTVE
jgi:hypothetical protein